jgi:uncharacterized protein involved in exopolysaccharide biosynthesis
MALTPEPLVDDLRPLLRWQAVLEAVCRRRQLVLAVFATGLLLTVLMALVAEPVYRASAKLMINPERSRITVSPDPKAGAYIAPVTDQDLNAEVALLRSPALLHGVLESFRDRIAEPPPRSVLAAAARAVRGIGELPGHLYRRLHGVGDPDPLDEWARRTSVDTEVVGVRGSNLIEASFTSPNPEWSAALLNRLVDEHVARHTELHQQAAAQAFLGSQRDLLHDRLRQAEAALAVFYTREGLDSVPEQAPVVRTRMAEFDTALADTDRALAEATARAGYLAEALAAHPKGAVAGVEGRTSPNQLIQSRIVELELQRSQLLTEYAPGSIKVRDVDRQLAHARRLASSQAVADAGTLNPSYLSLATELTKTRAEGAALAARQTALHGQLAAARAQIGRLDGISSEHERLEQAVASAKEAYLTYLKKEEEARFSAALDDSQILNVSVVEYAATPTVPLPARTGLNLLLGSLISLIAAVALGYLRDRLDPAVQTAAAAAHLTGLPVLADIPS